MYVLPGDHFVSGSILQAACPLGHHSSLCRRMASEGDACEEGLEGSRMAKATCVSCFLLWLPGSQSGGAGGSLPDDQWRSHFRMSGKVRESRLGGVGEDHPLEPAARLPLLPWWFSLLCLALLRPSAALLPLGWQRVDQQRFCSVRLVFAPLSDFSRVPRGWDSTKSAA